MKTKSKKELESQARIILGVWLKVGEQILKQSYENFKEWVKNENKNTN